jgi:mRNA (guanine-N7-)-methyltransferase
MPAFDPVRDAVLNSPVESRVTSSHSLAVILNDHHPSSRPSTHILAHAEPICRSSMDLNHISSSSTIPYNPKVRITPPGSVLTPLSQAEIDKYKSFRGQGVSRLTKRKRSASEETDERPVKRHAGDVGVVVEHCKWPLMFLVYSCSSCPSRQLTARCGNSSTSRITHHRS